MAFALRESRDAIARINITPLADVMLVLLAIVMIALPAMTLHVKTPVSMHAEDTRGRMPYAERVVVELRADGSLRWDGQSIDPSAIDAMMARSFTPNQRKVLALNVSDEAPYALLARVLASTQAHGISSIEMSPTYAPWTKRVDSP